MKSFKKKMLFDKRHWLIAFLAVLLILGVLELTNTTHLLHKNLAKNGAAPGSGQISAGSQGVGAATKTPQGTASAAASSQYSDTKHTSAQVDALLDPTGNFVSAHKNISADTVLSSVCNTTSGASCQIVFTNGSLTKSLASQIADPNGAAYWNSWTPADIGLSSGAWQVKAVASLGGKTKTTTDAMKLEVNND
jgi:hypothetical protein